MNQLEHAFFKRRKESNNMSKIKKAFWFTLGILLVGVAYLGVLLPGLPWSTPILGATFCFAKSSPRKRPLLTALVSPPCLREKSKCPKIESSSSITAACPAFQITRPPIPRLRCGPIRRRCFGRDGDCWRIANSTIWNRILCRKRM